MKLFFVFSIILVLISGCAAAPTVPTLAAAREHCASQHINRWTAAFRACVHDQRKPS